MTRGIFAVDRSIWDHPALGSKAPFSPREAWLWLISEAAWHPRRRVVGNITVELKRGQLVASSRFLASKWGWSEPAARRFLLKLQGSNAKKWGEATTDASSDATCDAMIDAHTDAHITVITIRNYDKYQFRSRSSDASSDARSDATSDATTDANIKNQINQQRKEEDPAANAAGSPTKGKAASEGQAKRYFFTYGCIRLSEKDFDAWKDAFTYLDIKAEMIAMEPWARNQKNWFLAIAGALNKKNGLAKIAATPKKVDPASRWISGIEGVT